MENLNLERTFDLIFAAYRSFMSLLDVEAQREALTRARQHLNPGGILILDLFDPALDLFTADPSPRPTDR